MVLVVVLACIGPTAAPAQQSEQKARSELKTIRSRIQALDKRLNQARMARDSLASELRHTEVEASELARDIRRVERDLGSRRKELGALKDRRESENESLATERQALGRDVRAAHAMGRQDYLKVLLNQRDPAMVSRVLTYYGYFTRARSERMDKARLRLQRLAEIERAAFRETEALAHLQKKKIGIQTELEQRRSARRQLLARIKNKIEDGGARLTRLKQDGEKLRELIVGLERELADIPKPLAKQQPFKTLRGSLPWPSAGKVQRRFGTRRQPGNLKWSGVWIDAPRGQPVRAISHGRIAYAEWLRGFGLLVIIDHGQGYMSLYGHNQEILKETGDWVQAGEVIGNVGDSGGIAESGLYFEIRHKGVPQNPVGWCQASG